MPTRLIRGLYNVTPSMQGGVVTIGNFDGVHLGHQALLARVLSEAKARRVPATVITFEPHPFEFFQQDKLTTPRITRLREKFYWLAQTGVDNVLILPFNQALAALPPESFVDQILHHSLRASHVMVGDDFRFGRARGGDVHLLTTLGTKMGFTVADSPSVLVAGVRVSSTLTRNALLDGDLVYAARLLGHPYFMHGRVRQGDQRGRQWGFPTANIYLHRKLTPVRGVYTVKVHDLADRPWPGVANIGVRPTVDGTRTLLEVHLLDFNQDIYGRYVRVEFCHKLRDEIRYANLAALQAQIAQDVQTARTYFNKMV